MEKAKKISQIDPSIILNDPVRSRQMLVLLDKLEAIEEQLEEWETYQQIYS